MADDDVEPDINDVDDSTPEFSYEDDHNRNTSEDIGDWESLGTAVAEKIERDIVAQVKYIRRWWNRNDFLKWFMRRQRVGWRFDHMLTFRAYMIWRELNRQGDHMTVVVGREGQGKSTLGAQLNSWVSPFSFNVDSKSTGPVISM